MTAVTLPNPAAPEFPVSRSPGAVASGAAWLGYLGAGDPNLLRRVDRTAMVCPGYGLALTDRSDGPCARTGPHAEAGASVNLLPDRGEAVLTTDPFGLYGAYVLRNAGTVWFASDPCLLRGIAPPPEELDWEGLHGYLCFSYVPTPRTLFPGIEAVPAGERWTISRHGVRKERMTEWQELAPEHTEEEEALRSLRQRLREAVERRLGATRDVGVYLSGGLDSSLIAALLIEAGARVRLFSLDFGPKCDGELPLARQVAAHLGAPLHVVPAGPREVCRAFRATARALHQPFGDPVTVPLYLLGRAAAAHVDTVFNGEGGDQLFGGWANKPMLAAELYGSDGYDREAAYLETFHRFHGQTDALYTRQARQRTAGLDAGRWIRDALTAEGFSSLLHRLRAANLRLKGAQNIAPRSTQLAAAHGLTAHSPFFDQRLAAWTFRLPPEWLLSGACERYLLKRAAEPYLPPEVIWQTKRGMGAPVSEWFSGALGCMAAGRLNPVRLAREDRFRFQAVWPLLRGRELPSECRGARRAGEKLWALLMLHAWLDANVSPKSKVQSPKSRS